jgi:hypothetical protein
MLLSPRGDFLSFLPEFYHGFGEDEKRLQHVDPKGLTESESPPRI